MKRTEPHESNPKEPHVSKHIQRSLLTIKHTNKQTADIARVVSGLLAKAPHHVMFVLIIHSVF